MSKQAAATKFSFKKEPRETGLRSIGYPHQSSVIKHNKKPVGIISAPCWSTKDGKWLVRFTVKSGESFKWISLKARFDSDAEARSFLQRRAPILIEQLDLHYMDE